MKRALLLGPALFTAACSLRPWTPSTTVAFGGEVTPPVRYTDVPSAAEAVKRWQLPSGLPWTPYSKLTLLAALDGAPRVLPLPDVSTLDVVAHADSAAYRVAEAGLPSDALWIVDLRGAASVTFGASLSRRAREPVAPVLTFNNWPHDDGLVPAEETLAALVAGMQPRLPAPGETRARPVFLLDAWRLAYRFDVPDDDVVDNRYVLSANDFPDVATLKAQGIRRVIYVVEDLDETEQEEDDMHDVLLAFRAAGLALHLVDLAWLAQSSSTGWDARLAGAPLVVEPRQTLLQDPAFYARARGGFGGVRSGPFPLRFGHGWSGTHHGSRGGFRGGGGGG